MKLSHIIHFTYFTFVEIMYAQSAKVKHKTTARIINNAIFVTDIVDSSLLLAPPGVGSTMYSDWYIIKAEVYIPEIDVFEVSVSLSVAIAWVLVDIIYDELLNNDSIIIQQRNGVEKQDLQKTSESSTCPQTSLI